MLMFIGCKSTGQALQTGQTLYTCSSTDSNQAVPADISASSGYNINLAGTTTVTGGVPTRIDNCVSTNSLYEFYCKSSRGYFSSPGEATGALVGFKTVACSSCQDGVCVPAPVCGNSVVETGEICDDGNTVDGSATDYYGRIIPDGCSANCKNSCQIDLNRKLFVARNITVTELNSTCYTSYPTGTGRLFAGCSSFNTVVLRSNDICTTGTSCIQNGAFTSCQ